jgi:hypothetical protein
LPSRGDIILVFLVSVFIIHTWSIYSFLHEVPAYVLRLSIWEILGILAYTQAFSLFESTLVLGILVILAFLLPRQLFAEKFVAQSTILVLITGGWLILPFYLNQTYQSIATTASLLGYIFFLTLMTLLVRMIPKFEDVLNGIAERLTVLAALFIVFDILSVLIIVYRNLASKIS